MGGIRFETRRQRSRSSPQRFDLTAQATALLPFSRQCLAEPGLGCRSHANPACSGRQRRSDRRRRQPVPSKSMIMIGQPRSRRGEPTGGSSSQAYSPPCAGGRAVAEPASSAPVRLQPSPGTDRSIGVPMELAERSASRPSPLAAPSPGRRASTSRDHRLPALAFPPTAAQHRRGRGRPRYGVFESVRYAATSTFSASSSTRRRSEARPHGGIGARAIGQGPEPSARVVRRFGAAA